MKRFFSTLAFCSLLLVLLSAFLFPLVEAKEDPIAVLLNLPAPPPPNPWVQISGSSRDVKFYSASSPPKDDAPIGDLLDYWRIQNNRFRHLGYNPKPSDRAAERLWAEIEKNPKQLPRLLNSLPEGERSGNLVKEIFDREGADGAFGPNDRMLIKRWLTLNTHFFSNDLARVAQNAGDADEYVSNQNELLALTRVDYDKAKPIIDRLRTGGTNKASGVLAKWALYRRALDTASTGDIETYRDELKAVVEDKTATDGMRDLALDALSKEKEWSGRDEWYYSLLADETLAELKVNGRVYTGLTTPLYYAPDEKYVARMVDLLRSENLTVRAAAIKNLILKLNTGDPEVVRALLPWLEDPNWAVDAGDARGAIVRQLMEIDMPESVPGLIKMIDEKQRPDIASNVMSSSANAARAVANAMNAAANMALANTNRAVQNFTLSNTVSLEQYRYRSPAVAALAKQKDMRAVPVLRRILPESEVYERPNLVGAILVCGGFSTAEQMAAIEIVARGVRDEMEVQDQLAPPGTSANGAAYNAAYLTANAFNAISAANAVVYKRNVPITAAEIRKLLGEQLRQSDEISDELAGALVGQIGVLDKRDPKLARAYRRMVLRWQNGAINLMLLSDVKRGVADVDSIVRLLGKRKELREKHSGDIYDLRTGKPSAVGLASCLLEDTPDDADLLDNSTDETKIALMACARLIRAPLPVSKVAESLRSTNQMLKTAAERYLESEDSPEARSHVLSVHPNEGRILGARTAFYVEGARGRIPYLLYTIFQSLGADAIFTGWDPTGMDDDIKAAEKNLQDEVRKDESLLGVYAYENNYIRIHKDRVLFSWDEDDTRYRERPLTKDEFDELKSYLTREKADELPPFLGCGHQYCEGKELLMLGRGGGRRIYANGSDEAINSGGNSFFAGLEKYFADLKRVPATLRYGLSRHIDGLEILLASDELLAETVWKNGSDLRVAASATAVRQKVSSDIQGLDEELGYNDGASYAELEQKKEEQYQKRRYEGVLWYKLVDGVFQSGAAQPPMVEFIPQRDGLAVEPSDEQWKGRAAAIEIRASDDGLFKVVGGKLTKLRTGAYGRPVITPNGRWVVVSKFDDDIGPQLVRIDLVTNREYVVAIEGYGVYPTAYVATLNKVLVVLDEDRVDVDVGRPPADPDSDLMSLVDAATGAVQPVAGQFGPLTQQTFRPLQMTSKPNEFWVAIANLAKNVTEVGVYDTKTFGFRPLLNVPGIRFNSMNMWVDEPGGKVYFVYRGHLLALPLPK